MSAGAQLLLNRSYISLKKFPKSLIYLFCFVFPSKSISRSSLLSNYYLPITGTFAKIGDIWETYGYSVVVFGMYFLYYKSKIMLCDRVGLRPNVVFLGEGCRLNQIGSCISPRGLTLEDVSPHLMKPRLRFSNLRHKWLVFDIRW